MASGFINSIINKNSIISEVKDTLNPYSFIEYIVKTSDDNTTDSFKNYKDYLVEWSKVKSSDTFVDTRSLIQNEVINLLKVLTVSYATYEEQSFIANLNWDINTMTAEDKASIYAALPIFVSRLKDIADFYRKKRTDTTFIIERNKINGTNLSLEKIIYDKIINYLYNNDKEQINYVQNYLNIFIDKYVDVYSEYFDVDRGKTTSANYNNIDQSIYFELKTILEDMLFDGNVYLKEIPLIAQLSIDFTQDCIGDKLTLKNKLVAESQLSLIPDDEKIALRKKLYEKYLGTDFYYLYKDEAGNITTDIFIKAENPTNNLLNQQTADTPFDTSTQLELLKNIGLFFKPNKNSILKVNTYNFEYVIDNELVEENKVYIFPDPKLYGNVSFNNQKDYPFIIEYTFDEYIKNTSSGWANLDPFLITAQQPVFSYYSKEQDIQKINKNNQVKLDFDDLYNKGFISSFKSDLYGNKFALIKEKTGKFAKVFNIKDNIINIGDNIDNIGDSSIYFEVNGGNLGLKDDMAPADDYNWTPNNHYYEYFIEGGISAFLTEYKLPQRAYFENYPTGPGNGNLSLSVKDAYKLSNETAFIDGKDFKTVYTDYQSYFYDGGQIENVNIEKYHSTKVIKPEDDRYIEAAKKNYYDIMGIPGTLYISTLSQKKTSTITDLLPWLTEYSNNIIDMDIIENTIILYVKNIDNENIIIFDTLNYDFVNDSFTKGNKEPLIFKFNNKKLSEFTDGGFFGGNENIYNKVSNIYYLENKHKCYFVTFDIDNATQEGKTYPICIPKFIEINLKTLESKEYTFDTTDEAKAQCAESFKMPNTLFNSGITVLQKVGDIALAYSNDINKFMVSYILYDSILSPHIYKHFIKLKASNMANYGIIDHKNIESTIYIPGSVENGDVFAPGNTEAFETNFVTNYIVS